MTPPKKKERNADSRNEFARRAKSRYNGERNSGDVEDADESSSGPPRRNGDVTVVVPSQPPVISPQAGRALLRILFEAASDQPGSDTTRRAA